MTSYALTVSGHAYSWGFAGSDSLGHGPGEHDLYTPKRIEALADIARISAGDRCDAFTHQGVWFYWGLAENAGIPGMQPRP
eukprot:1517031-Prymnesium_polylepis.1